MKFNFNPRMRNFIRTGDSESVETGGKITGKYWRSSVNNYRSNKRTIFYFGRHKLTNNNRREIFNRKTKPVLNFEKNKIQ